MVWVVNTTPRPIYPRERPGTHWIGGWVCPRAGMDECGKSRTTGIRSPDREDCSGSLNRLSHAGPLCSTHSDNENSFPQKFIYVFSFYSHGKRRLFKNWTLTGESTHLIKKQRVYCEVQTECQLSKILGISQQNLRVTKDSYTQNNKTLGSQQKATHKRIEP